MSHPRVEEVSDSDSDPDVIDISTLPSHSQHALMPADAIPTSVTSTLPLRSAPPPTAPPSQPQPLISRETTNAPPPESKTWAMLYPIYFDVSASRNCGRRVSVKRAVENPLAHKIAEACTDLGLSTVFEPGKTHPKDWANPGRVRVRLREEEGGRWVAGGVKNSTPSLWDFGIFLLTKRGN
jgi:signal recognition particle subunit SRP19